MTQDVISSLISQEKELISFFIDEVLLFWKTDSLLKSYSPISVVKRTNPKFNKVVIRSSQNIAKKPQNIETEKQESEIQKPPIAQSKENVTKENPTNWQLNPLIIDPSSDEFLKLNFKCLKNHSLKLIHTPAAVLLVNPSSQETLFFQRFTKVVTQFFFPCRLLLVQEQPIDFMTHFQNYEIMLLHHDRIHTIFKDIVPHEPYLHQHTTVLSILSYENYQQDPQLKKQLWMQLQQLTMSVTRK